MEVDKEMDKKKLTRRHFITINQTHYKLNSLYFQIVIQTMYFFSFLSAKKHSFIE
jgi:hypothetical protein